MFAPDVISGPAHDSAPAFAPDGKTVYFTRSNSAASTMGAEVNSPSSDAEARLSPDGRTLYFASDRVLPVKFPRARGATTPAWDNGLYNIWSIDLAPWLAR